LRCTPGVDGTALEEQSSIRRERKRCPRAGRRRGQRLVDLGRLDAGEERHLEALPVAVNVVETQFTSHLSWLSTSSRRTDGSSFSSGSSIAAKNARWR
jgi:hypothetical protein